MKFLVDSMLGGLARWLRILGHDVTYDSQAHDNDILRLARDEEMILLTRDEELYRRANARHLRCALVGGEREVERLAQISIAFSISLEGGQILVRSARQAIAEHLDGRQPIPDNEVEPELAEPHGVFVTLLEKS